jgi:hypothetical protein
VHCLTTRRLDPRSSCQLSLEATSTAAAPRSVRISDMIEAGRGRRATLAKPGARL